MSKEFKFSDTELDRILTAHRIVTIKEILNLMEDEKDYVAGSCECCDKYLKILLQIRSLLTK